MCIHINVLVCSTRTDLIMDAYVWMAEQQLGHTSGSFVGCQNERSVSIVALGIHVCSSIDQHFSYRRATPTEKSYYTGGIFQGEKFYKLVH